MPPIGSIEISVAAALERGQKSVQTKLARGIELLPGESMRRPDNSRRAPVTASILPAPPGAAEPSNIPAWGAIAAQSCLQTPVAA